MNSILITIVQARTRINQHVAHTSADPISPTPTIDISGGGHRLIQRGLTQTIFRVHIGTTCIVVTIQNPPKQPQTKLNPSNKQQTCKQRFKNLLLAFGSCNVCISITVMMIAMIITCDVHAGISIVKCDAAADGRCTAKFERDSCWVPSNYFDDLLSQIQFLNLGVRGLGWWFAIWGFD
jgi:hypothetical protein